MTRRIEDPSAPLRLLSTARQDEICVLSESARQDWPLVSTTPNLDIGITGSMGKASSVGLGLALARPDRRVWVLDSDGALLMNLGSLVSIAKARPANLLHFVLDNDAYDTTGGQPTPGAGMVDFASVGRGAGLPETRTYDDLAAFERDLAGILSGTWPLLIVLKVASLGRRERVGEMKPMRESFVTIRDYLARA